MKKSRKSRFDKGKDKYCVSYIPLTSIVPVTWNEWFYEMIATDAPFSWGDNNQSLITATRLANHAEERFADQDNIEEAEIMEWLTEVRLLGDFFIDLEH